MQGLPSVEMLEKVHAFPGPFTFKLFGPGDSRLLDEARDLALTMISDKASIELSQRASSKGAHVCVSVTARVDSAHHVRELYIAFVALESVTFTM